MLGEARGHGKLEPGVTPQNLKERRRTGSRGHGPAASTGSAGPPGLVDSDVRLKRNRGHGHSACHAAGPVQPGSDSGSAVVVPSAARRRAAVLRGGGQ